MFELTFHFASVFMKCKIDFFQFLTVPDLTFGFVLTPGVVVPQTPSHSQVQMWTGLKAARSASVQRQSSPNLRSGKVHFISFERTRQCPKMSFGSLMSGGRLEQAVRLCLGPDGADGGGAAAATGGAGGGRGSATRSGD